MIKAAIIGLGRMGVSHFAILNRNPNVELIASCEPSNFISAGIEKYTDVKCYKDYKKMLKKENLNCVLITTPTRLHYEMVKHALENRLHIFVEKPFCLTPEEGKDLVDLSESKKVINQVGYHNRFIGTFNEMKRLVESDAIGEVYHVLGEAYGPVVLKAKGGTWRSEASKGGGCLYDYATHVINLIQFVVGNPDRVAGTIKRSIYSVGVDDAVYTSLYFPNGITGQLSVNWSDETYRKMSTQLTVHGTKGKIIADSQELKIYLKEKPSQNGYEKGWNMRWVTDLSPEIGFYLRGEEYTAQLEYFIECIKENNLDNINSFKNAYETDYIVDLIKKNVTS